MDFDAAEIKWKNFWSTRFSLRTRLICTLIFAPFLAAFLFLIYWFMDDAKVVMIVIFMTLCFHVFYFIWFKGSRWKVEDSDKWKHNIFVNMEDKKWQSIKEEREQYYEEQRKNAQEERKK